MTVITLPSKYGAFSGVGTSRAAPLSMAAGHTIRLSTDPIYFANLKLVSLEAGFGYAIYNKDAVLVTNGEYTSNPTIYSSVTAETVVDDISVYFLKYGNLYKKSTFVITDIETLMFMAQEVNSNVTEANSATVAAYTITVNKTNKTITASGTNTSLANIYDYMQYWQSLEAQNDILVDGEILSTVLGDNYTLDSAWTIIFDAVPSGAFDVSGGNIYFNFATGTISNFNYVGTVSFDSACTITATDSQIDALDTVDGNETVSYTPAGSSNTPTNNDDANITIVAPTYAFTINSNVSADIKVFTTTTQTIIAQDTGTTVNTETSGTYDITVMAQGYLPQRQTGKVFGGTADVTIDFELISDPIYNDSHTLVYPTHLTYNRTLKELTLLDRRAGRDIYSALIDAFIDQSTLDNTPFDFQAVGIDSIFFLEDAVLATGSEDNWFDAGIRYINSSDVVTAEWCSIKSSGTIPSGVTGRYQTGQGTGTTALRVSGAVNQIIQIYKTGNFDYRNYLVIKFQANPYIDTRSDILALAGVSTLEPFEYSVAIEPTTLDITVGTGGATLTLVDHTAIPKVVGGKSFSYEIIDGGTATAEDILRTWDYNIAQAADYLTYPSFNLPEFIAQSGTTYETRQGIVESEGDTLYGCYVSRAGGDHPDFTRHQSDDGTYYVAPVQVTVAMPNIIDGTRVYLYNEDTTSIMDNSIVSGGAGYAFSLEYTTDINVYYKICYQSGQTQKLPIRGNAIITSAGLTIVSTQVDDTIVNEYCASSGVDGSLVDSSNGGEITADFANVQIDVNDPDNIFDARKAVAWWRYICTTETGIAMYNPDALSFNPDIYNIGVDGALQVENIKASPLKVTGGIWLRADGGDLIASTSNTIFWTPNDRVYSTVIETGVSGLTATESTKLDSINSSTAQLTFTNANEVDVNVKSNNDSPVYGSGTSTDKWRGEP